MSAVAMAVSSGLTQRQARYFREFGNKIGDCVTELSALVISFVKFMKTQRYSLKQLRCISQAFNEGVREATKDKKHANNLLYTIWDVLKQGNFELLDKNCTRNRLKNSNRLIEIQNVVEVTEVDEPTEICQDCKLRGFLILCDSCSLGWHLKCAGLKAGGHKTHKTWYCRACNPESQKEPESHVDEDENAGGSGGEHASGADQDDEARLSATGSGGKEAESEDGNAVVSGGGPEAEDQVEAGLGAATGSGGGGAGKEAQSEDEDAVSNVQESVPREVSFTRMSEKLSIVSTQLLSLQEEKAPKRVYHYLYKINTYLSKLDSTQNTSERHPIFKLFLENWTFLLSENSRLCIRGRICRTKSSHPNMANGTIWTTTAISNVVEDGIVVTVTGSLYGLVGPAELPAQLKGKDQLTQTILDTSVAPFGTEKWPSNASALLEHLKICSINSVHMSQDEKSPAKRRRIESSASPSQGSS